jgi:hypothetical protein
MPHSTSDRSGWPTSRQVCAAGRKFRRDSISASGDIPRVTTEMSRSHGFGLKRAVERNGNKIHHFYLRMIRDCGVSNQMHSPLLLSNQSQFFKTLEF